MTKKEKNLERRNKFLLLQLKKISNLADQFSPFDDVTKNNVYRILALSEFQNIKTCVESIEKFDADYNFYDKSMDINDYSL